MQKVVGSSPISRFRECPLAEAAGPAAKATAVESVATHGRACGRAVSIHPVSWRIVARLSLPQMLVRP